MKLVLENGDGEMMKSNFIPTEVKILKSRMDCSKLQQEKRVGKAQTILLQELKLIRNLISNTEE